MSSFLRRLVLLSTFAAMVLPAAHAARVSDVKSTKHNLSSSGPGPTKAAPGGTTQICVFCHTPHGANTSMGGPLWNRNEGSATYIGYDSLSLDAKDLTVQSDWSGQPLGSSKLCLSCHDGTIALGNVVNAPGSGLGSEILIGGVTGTKMPAGTDGYTRNLGGNLANDHPISVTYSTALTSRDGELRPLASMPMITNTSKHPLVGVRTPREGSGIGNLVREGITETRPVLPLEKTGASGAGQVQCTTCHDPHIKESTLTGSVNTITEERNIKFLRRNRFQMAAPTAAYSDNDIMCLACHQKGHNGPGGVVDSFSWAYSAHANPNVAGHIYKAGAADVREFPQGMPVWKVACLNCHDTHTVTGARRLTRLGGTGVAGGSTLEATCYQCHSSSATILETAGAFVVGTTPTTGSVPDIATDFAPATPYKMPITGTEVHDIGGADTTACKGVGGMTRCGADGVESQTLLANRHVECTDCHNPHRVVRLHRYDGNVTPGGVFTAGINITPGAGDDKEGTHFHKDASGYTHTNVASGVLRGAWGVEPGYSKANSANFNISVDQNDYTVRRGDPGSDSLSAAQVAYTAVETQTYATREYQVCLKCHSSYAYGTNLPPLGVSTPSGTNQLTNYTDQAREFHAPATHTGNAADMGNEGGAHTSFDAGNRRSWHPVMRPTGRTAALRGNITATKAFRLPWSNAVGTQTMYCSDCHGSNVTSATSVIPTGTALTGTSDGSGSPWGPHGSTNPFILKGTWDDESGGASVATTICLKCHVAAAYTTSSDAGNDSSGFCCDNKGNLHNYHVDRIGRIECTWCHIAVPHGWKNKALLVNLNDVGPEAEPVTCPNGGCEVRMGSNTTRVNSDYYTKAP